MRIEALQMICDELYPSESQVIKLTKSVICRCAQPINLPGPPCGFLETMSTSVASFRLIRESVQIQQHLKQD